MHVKNNIEINIDKHPTKVILNYFDIVLRLQFNKEILFILTPTCIAAEKH